MSPLCLANESLACRALVPLAAARGPGVGERDVKSGYISYMCVGRGGERGEGERRGGKGRGREGREGKRRRGERGRKGERGRGNLCICGESVVYVGGREGGLLVERKGKRDTERE